MQKDFKGDHFCISYKTAAGESGSELKNNRRPWFQKNDALTGSLCFVTSTLILETLGHRSKHNKNRM